jgi:hypothetical protein
MTATAITRRSHRVSTHVFASPVVRPLPRPTSPAGQAYVW